MFSARSTEGQNYLINRIQNPGKDILGKIFSHSFGFPDIIRFIQLWRDLAALPEPEIYGMDDNNSRILLSIRDDFIKRLKLTAQYVGIFSLIFKYIIHKNHSDKNYSDWFNWLIAECIIRGWEFASINEPPSKLWETKMSDKKEKLLSVIRSHYDVMQHKGADDKALKQFLERVLDSIDQEVLIWKGVA